MPPRAKELSPQDVPHGSIRELIVRLRGSLGSDGSDHFAAGASCVHTRWNARIRTRVDEDASIDEDPVGFLEGIDHALVRNSSERPREDHHVERRVRQSKRLGGSLAELDIGDSLALRMGSPARERGTVWVDRQYRLRVLGGTQREPSLARADVGHPKSSQVEAVCREL